MGAPLDIGAHKLQVLEMFISLVPQRATETPRSVLTWLSLLIGEGRLSPAGGKCGHSRSDRQQTTVQIQNLLDSLSLGSCHLN